MLLAASVHAHGGHPDAPGFMHVLVHFFDVDHILIMVAVAAVGYVAYRKLRGTKS